MKKLIGIIFCLSINSVFAMDISIPFKPVFSGGAIGFSSDSSKDIYEYYTTGPIFLTTGQYSYEMPSLMHDEIDFDNYYQWVHRLKGSSDTVKSQNSIKASSTILIAENILEEMEFEGEAKSVAEIQCQGGKAILKDKSSVSGTLVIDESSFVANGTVNQVINTDIGGDAYKITFNEQKITRDGDEVTVVRNAIRVQKKDGERTFTSVIAHSKAKAICK